MLSWRRILSEPFGKKSSSEEDDTAPGEEPGKDAAGERDSILPPIVSLEDLVNMSNDTDEDLAEIPEGSKGLLTRQVKLGAEPAAENEGDNTLFKINEDEESETEDEEAGDSISSLFSDDDEEEENPLTGLINALPEVTAGELIKDMQEVKAMVNQWRRGSAS